MPTTPTSAPASAHRQKRPGGRGARVAAAVYEAALGLLVDEGRAPSIPAIARRAVVHETSIYRRWKTKEAVLLCAIEAHLLAEIPVPDTGSFRHDLRTFLQSSHRFLQSPIGRQFIRASVTHGDTEDARLQRAYWHNRLAGAQAIFARARQRGVISPDADTQGLAELLFAPALLRATLTYAPLDASYTARQMDLILRASQARRED